MDYRIVRNRESDVDLSKSLRVGDSFVLYISTKNEGTDKTKIYLALPNCISYSDISQNAKAEECDNSYSEMPQNVKVNGYDKVYAVTTESNNEFYVVLRVSHTSRSKRNNKEETIIIHQASRKNEGPETIQNTVQISICVLPSRLEIYKKSILDVFGYALIGVFSYLFGLVLNWYNINHDIWGLSAIYSKEESIVYPIFSSMYLSPKLLFVLVIQVLVICLFSHAYAKVYLLQNALNTESKERENAYTTIGRWIEISIFVVIVAAFVVIFCMKKDVAIIGVVFFNSILFLISSSRYRFGRSMPEDARYILVCPAILMIGLNIYLGASLDLLLRYEAAPFLTSIPVFAFFFVMYVFIKKNQAKVVYWLFVSILFLIGLLSLILPKDILNLCLRNMALCIVTSIFMAIFESWYIPFRQLEGRSSPKERTFVRVVNVLLFLWPIFLLVLYPFQEFGLGYLVLSIIGTFIASLLWFFIVYPSIGKPTEGSNRIHVIAFLRGAMGLLTLIVLFLDKFGLLDGIHFDNTLAENTSLKIIFTIASLVIGGIFGIISLKKPGITLKEYLSKDKIKSAVMTTSDEKNKYISNFCSLQNVLLVSLIPIFLLIAPFISDNYIRILQASTIGLILVIPNLILISINN